MNIRKILSTLEGRIIVSIIWGLGLSCLFRRVCKGRNCIIYRAPNPMYIKGNVYKHNKKCYNYKTENVNCKDYKNIVQPQ